MDLLKFGEKKIVLKIAKVILHNVLKYISGLTKGKMLFPK